jgi:hypothetical protein
MGAVPVKAALTFWSGELGTVSAEFAGSDAVDCVATRTPATSVVAAAAAMTSRGDVRDIWASTDDDECVPAAGESAKGRPDINGAE